MVAKLTIVIRIAYISRAYYYKYAALPKSRSPTLEIVAMELTNLSDEALVTHYRQEGRDPRDPKLLAELVRRHETRVISACALHVKDRETARDLAQEVWIRVFTKLDQFRPERAAFVGWLFIIVRNRCHDHRRRDKHHLHEEISRKIVDRLEDDLDTEGVVKPTVEILRELMELISGEEKRLLSLRYDQGYSIKEVQHIMGLSEPCVKTRVARARHKLQQLLEKYREASPA